MLTLRVKYISLWVASLALILAACAPSGAGDQQTPQVTPAGTLAAASAIPALTQTAAGPDLSAPTQPPVPTDSPEATPGEDSAGAPAYLDDRSTPSGLMQSYFNAINRKEYLRAYSYWNDPAGVYGPFDQFQASYEDTLSVELTLGQVGGDAGAGQFYYSVPALLAAQDTGGETHTYAACYILRLSNPGAQAAPPFTPLGIERAKTELVGDLASASVALAKVCSGPDFPPSNPIPPPPVTDPGDISAGNYLDNRSGPVEVLRSYFNAINRKEFSRAYSYWEETGAGAEVGPFEQFERGYANTESVQLTTGEVVSEAGAGQFYYAVPTVLKTQTTGGETQIFAGCYYFHLANPAIQAEPPFRPLAIRSAEVEQVAYEADPASLLNQDCAP